MTENATDVKPSRVKRRVLVVLKLVVVGSLVVWVLRSIVRDASSLDWSNLIQQPLWLTAALACWLAAFAFRGWVWGAMMRRTGYPVGHVAGMRVFFASHLGRFLPGKIWSVAGAGIFGKTHGLPAQASVAGMAVFLIVYYIVGSLVALLVILRLTEAKVAVAIGIGACGAIALAALASPLLPKLLDWVGKKFKRDLSALQLPTAGTLVLTAVSLAVVWVAAGTGFTFLFRSLQAPVANPMPLLTGVGAYASALVAGFAALFAPAGLGVREAVMLGLLEPSVGSALAGVGAITSRLVITSLTLMLSLWGAWPYLMERRAKARTEGNAGAPELDDGSNADAPGA